MYSSGRNVTSEPKHLNSSRVSSMMREYDIFQQYNSRRTSRSVLAPINLDESETQELCIRSPIKVRVLDVSATDNESSSSPVVSDLRRRLVEKDLEVQHATAIISNLKAKLQNLEPETKKTKIEYEKQLELKNKDCENLKDKLLRLTNHIQLLEEQESNSQARYEEEKGKLRSDYNKMSQKVKLLQIQKDEYDTQIEKIKVENASTVKQLQNEVMRLKLELRLSNDEKDQLDQQHKSVVKQMQEKVVEETLRVKLELDSKITELELELKRRNNNDVIVSSMRDDLNRLISLEKECEDLREENRSLRQNRENIFLLKEKLLSVQTELSNYKFDSDKSKSLQLENHDLRYKLEKWESVANSPSAASNFISQLQRNEITLTDQSGKLKSELLSAKTNVIELEKQVSLSQSQLKQCKDTQDISNANMKRLSRKLLLLSKECESYKNIINAYENEVTVNIHDASSGKVAMLEQLLKDYKEVIATYETDMKAVTEGAREKGHGENELLLKAEIRKLEQQVQNLEKQVQGYESLKVVPTKEQIWHFRGNPVASADFKRQQDIKEVKEENERLRTRVQVLESGKTADVTANVEQLLKEHGGDTVESLRNQLSLVEQKNKRMMEAFKKTSQEFREVVYILTGFRIDLSSTNKYKLSHVYGESPHDYLLFEQTNNGEINLVETDYSKSIHHLIEEYLLKLNSIPAFLSNMTLELFYRQTSVLHA